MPKSEFDVLTALTKLPDSFHVFHGVDWLNLKASRSAKNKQRVGEIDLVVVHAKHGILVVEVKGGKEICLKDGSWYSVAHDTDQAHRLSRSPAQQARENMYLLKQKLEEKNIIMSYSFDQGLLGYAVWFPGVDKSSVANLPLDLASTAQILDQDSLFDPLTDIEAAFQSWRPNHATAMLDKMQVTRICSVLAPEIIMVPSLRLNLKRQEEDLLALTNEQQQAFKMIQTNRRLLVSGGAGTGKTLLAIEDARDQLRAGRKTLFLCFNRLLSEYLRRELADVDNIMVSSFHGFVEGLCKQAGMPFDIPEGSKEKRLFFQEKCPLLLIEAADYLLEKYDAIIVDEGQDFLPDWWDALECVMVENAVFHCFHDANQSLFQDDWKKPFEEPKYGPLMVNCRNTAPIGAMARKLAGIDVDEQYRCAEGIEPKVVTYSNCVDQRKKLALLLDDWIEHGRLTPDQVVILSPYQREKSVAAVEKIGRWRVYDIEPNSIDISPGITFSTMRAFKGLEADAVIIVDIDGGRWSMDSQSFYVAASRAKHLLAIFTHKDAQLHLNA